MSLLIKNSTVASFHIAGILGSGMSAIAQFLAWTGCTVTGSDRLLDKEETSAVQTGLARAGCSFRPQDGSGVCAATGAVVVSTAIEESNPDIAAALRLGIQVHHRSDILAAIVTAHETIAVAGTSGKSTVTALCFELLRGCGRNPSLITGAPLKSLVGEGYIGNAYRGNSNLLVIEADESDGTLVKYHPAASVFLNVSKDHKPIDETMGLFATLAGQSAEVLVNNDDPLIAGLPHGLSFGLGAQAEVHPDRVDSISPAIGFVRKEVRFSCGLMGRHNLMNILAALAVTEHLGCALPTCSAALRKFQGIDRRFTVIGKPCGVTVIDDYAHNPEKIRAALEAAQAIGRRVFAVFQPHGYGPTRFMRRELVETFDRMLRKDDCVMMMPIYYAGGSAQKDISSEDLVNEIIAKGKSARVPADRAECCRLISGEAGDGDVVLVMGARDPSLSAFAVQIAQAITA